MVKKVEHWQAEDGTLFATLVECEEYEVKQLRFKRMEEHFGFDFTDYHGVELLDFIEKYTKGWK